jgi:SNF2 family DNA or RNA helicase
MVDKMLVVVPLKPMYGTWPTEIEKYDEFKHLTWCFLHGPDKDYHLENTQADVYLVNPEGVQWLTSKCDPSRLADVLCVDESTKFKNSSSKRFKALRRIFPRFQYRWIGTGTPSPNGLTDLFGQVFILDGGASLGKYVTHFRNKYFYTEPWDQYNYLPLPNAFEDITKAIAPLVLVMEAKDYLDMPELMVIDKSVQLPPKALKMYQDIEKEFIATIPETTDLLVAPTAAAAGAKCRQIANGAVYVEGEPWSQVHNEKLDMLDELQDEIGEHPILIVYEFKHDLERIRARFPDWQTVSGKSGEDLARMVERFNKGQVRRLLIQSSAGHGLNIQASCHHMIWFGLTWNWEDYKQMVDRLYRQGQRSTMVMVYRILAESTLDATIATALENKRQEEANVKRRATEHREEIFGN